MSGKKRTLNEQPFLHRAPKPVRRKMLAQNLLDDSGLRQKGGAWYRKYLEFTAMDEGEKAQALARKYTGAKLAQMQLRRQVTLSEEREIRGWVRRILEEDHRKLLTEQEYGMHGEVFAPATTGELAKLFLGGIQDVLKTTKVALKDMLTSAKYMWDMVFTFDPVKLYNMRKEYKSRKERIDEEYKEVMADTWASMAGPDVKAAMFLLSPAAFLASAPITKSWKNRKDIADFFRESGFGSPSEEEKKKGAQDPKGIIGTAGALLGKLRDIFLESPEDTHLISEQKGVDVSDIQDAIKEVNPNAMSKMEKAGEEYVGLTSKFLDDIYELFGKNIVAIRTIKGAKSIDELVTAMEKVKASGFDIGGPSPQEIKQQFDKSVKDLATGPDKEKFIDATVKSLGKKSADEVSQEELLKAASDSIFVHSSEKIRSDLEEVEVDLLEKLKEAIGGVRPTVQEAELLKQSSTGKEFLETIDEFDRKIMAIK